MSVAEKLGRNPVRRGVRNMFAAHRVVFVEVALICRELKSIAVCTQRQKVEYHWEVCWHEHSHQIRSISRPCALVAGAEVEAVVRSGGLESLPQRKRSRI